MSLSARELHAVVPILPVHPRFPALNVLFATDSKRRARRCCRRRRRRRNQRSLRAAQPPSENETALRFCFCGTNCPPGAQPCRTAVAAARAVAALCKDSVGSMSASVLLSLVIEPFETDDLKVPARDCCGVLSHRCQRAVAGLERHSGRHERGFVHRSSPAQRVPARGYRPQQDCNGTGCASKALRCICFGLFLIQVLVDDALCVCRHWVSTR